MRPTLLLLVLAIACMTSAALAAPAASTTGTTKAPPEVLMYATKTCGYCVKARAWFTNRGVAWEERDVETSATANAEWKALGGQGTPLLVINGKRILGFSEREIEIALAKTD